MACKNIYQSLNSVTEMEEVSKMGDMTVDELKNKKLWFYGLQSQPRMEK